MELDLNVTLKFDLSDSAKEWIMSVVSDAIAKLSTSTDAAVARVQGDLATLTAQITALEAQVAAGGATPADIAAIAAIQAKIDAIDPTSPVVLPPVVPPVVPPTP